MDNNHLRHHEKHAHLAAPIGQDDAFGRWAEDFARFFGTPRYMVLQTLFTIAWIIGNLYLLFHFDPYPFICLNLFYSIQAGYAAPLILCAQTRQADRDKAHADADARHREELAQQHRDQADKILVLTNQVHALTMSNHQLSEEIHRQMQNAVSRNA